MSEQQKTCYTQYWTILGNKSIGGSGKSAKIHKYGQLLYFDCKKKEIVKITVNTIMHRDEDIVEHCSQVWCNSQPKCVRVSFYKSLTTKDYE